MDSTLDFLKRLDEQGARFVVVGGVAGVAHGSTLVTEDLDVCAPLTRENLAKILAALRGLHPCWRMTQNHRPLAENPTELAGYKNLYLTTDLGQIDIISEIAGVGDFADVVHESITLDLGPVSCRVLDLGALIRSKRALARPKDLQAAAELEAIRERRICPDTEGE
ncbi:MAG: nucleotidyltransferase [Phycisphaerae bacterium]